MVLTLCLLIVGYPDYRDAWEREIKATQVRAAADHYENALRLILGQGQDKVQFSPTSLFAEDDVVERFVQLRDKFQAGTVNNNLACDQDVKEACIQRLGTMRKHVSGQSVIDGFRTYIEHSAIGSCPNSTDS